MTHPLYYASGDAVFCRPVKTSPTSTRMGFKVCEASDGVNATEIADELNQRDAALAALKELVAAGDALTSFVLTAEPKQIGEEAWREEHARRVARKAAAANTAGRLIAEAGV